MKNKNEKNEEKKPAFTMNFKKEEKAEELPPEQPFEEKFKELMEGSLISLPSEDEVIIEFFKNTKAAHTRNHFVLEHYKEKLEKNPMDIQARAFIDSINSEIKDQEKHILYLVEKLKERKLL